MATPTTHKQNCLVVVSTSPKGVSSQSFVQVYNILHQAQLHIQLASLGGKQCQLINQDDTNRKWIADFRSKSYSHPIALESVDASRYAAIVIPHSPGAVEDLARNSHMGELLTHFLENDKLICAIGQGCAALCSARKDQTWSFKGRCLTSMSVYELAKQDDFPSMNLIVEDFMKDNGANYSANSDGRMHVVIDGHVITGQNEQSTLTAVQNLVLLSTITRTKNTTAISRSHSPR